MNLNTQIDQLLERSPCTTCIHRAAQHVQGTDQCTQCPCTVFVPNHQSLIELSNIIVHMIEQDDSDQFTYERNMQN